MTVQPVIMPKLGAYTEDVLLAEWHVEEGAEVAAGSVVLEMETDKTTAEIEAETAGWLHRLVAAGEKVTIGTRVGLVAETREEYEALVGQAEPPLAANPFLGYLDQGGAETVAAVAGAGGSTSPAPAFAAPADADQERREGPSSRLAPGPC